MTSLTLAVDLFAVAKGFPVRLPYKRDPTLHMIMTSMVSLVAPVSLVAHVSLGLGLEPKKPFKTLGDFTQLRLYRRHTAFQTSPVPRYTTAIETRYFTRKEDTRNFALMRARLNLSNVCMSYPFQIQWP